MSKKYHIFLDSGDTIIDERTEVRDDNDIVIHAELIPGADEMVKTLKQRGYQISLVADGLTQSFVNMFIQHDILNCFDAFVTSEAVGVQKPDPAMFRTAMAELELEDDERGHVIMLGNNLARDIVGANEYGLISVHIDWTTRYPKEPSSPSEQPDYVIHEPMEFIDLLERLEA